MMKPQETLTDIRTPHKMAESSGVFIRRWRNMIIEIGVQRPGRIDSVKGKIVTTLGSIQVLLRS